MVTKSKYNRIFLNPKSGFQTYKLCKNYLHTLTRFLLTCFMDAVLISEKRDLGDNAVANQGNTAGQHENL